jgi:beta-glucosidase
MAAYFKVHPQGTELEQRVEINFSAWTQETNGPAYPSANMSWEKVNSHVDVMRNGEHAALIREIGAKGIVLLKNEGVLPLKRPESMAILGEDAFDNPGGPNACADRGCNNGTLAMGWGSGTSDFPYLVSPFTALYGRTQKEGTDLSIVTSNFDLEVAREAAAGVELALVFANANAGENYIVIEDNAGDRQNLTLWKGGDELIRTVASVQPNTILILHTVGPVLIEEYKNHPNITAILWAGLPGQESGNSLLDVLYGTVNPQGRTPFTWAKKPSDYGANLLYTSPSRSPSQDLNAGLFIDYRHFDAKSIEPSYEFGFGLSYTTFTYSDLKISDQHARSYEANHQGMTGAAPTYGLVNGSREEYMMPKDFRPVPKYVYSFLKEGGKPPADVKLPEQARSREPRRILSAGGAPGGNPGLYEVLYKISATVENSGNVTGTEIAQLVRKLFSVLAAALILDATLPPFFHHSRLSFTVIQVVKENF